MKALLAQYKTLPEHLHEYLPDATGVLFQPVDNKQCKSMDELQTELTTLFNEQPVSGWVTRQSDTLLIDSEIGTSSFEQPWLQAELSNGELSISIYYADLQWHVSVLSVNENTEPNALAVTHSYAIDSLRFPGVSQEDVGNDKTGSLRQINYWVLWQIKADQDNHENLVPVAQFLRGIETVNAADEQPQQGDADAA